MSKNSNLVQCRIPVLLHATDIAELIGIYMTHIIYELFRTDLFRWMTNIGASCSISYHKVAVTCIAQLQQTLYKMKDILTYIHHNQSS